MKSSFGAITGLIFVIGVAAAVDVWNVQQLENAKRGNDLHIRIRNMQVPAGVQLNLQNLKPGTTVEFAGKVTFGYKEWAGPLIRVSGNNLKITGAAGNLIDGEGARWWDGKGVSGGKKKPQMMELLQLYNSVVSGLNIKNAPAKIIRIDFSNDLELHNIFLDNGDGRGKAFNTDGFCLGVAKNIYIHHVTVINQDDCLCVLATDNVRFEYAVCKQGNGVSVGSMSDGWTVRGLTVREVTIIDSFNGLRIKTKKNHKALVQDITWDHVVLQDIQHRGIIIHGNYPTWSPTDEPDNKIPIKNLLINRVRGTVQKGGSNIWIWLGNGVAQNWRAHRVNISGGGLKLACKGVPAGLDIQCG